METLIAVIILIVVTTGSVVALLSYRPRHDDNEDERS